MVIRVSIANAQLRSIAVSLQAAGLSATLSRSMGVGDWGIERGITAEFACKPATGTAPRIRRWTLEWLKDHGEQAAYVTWADGEGVTAWLWWADGRSEEIG